MSLSWISDSLEQKYPTSRPLFSFLFVFSAVNGKFVQYKTFLLTGFEPLNSGFRSDRSANWATATAKIISHLLPCSLIKKLPKSIKLCPKGEISPNLVTLLPWFMLPAELLKNKKVVGGAVLLLLQCKLKTISRVISNLLHFMRFPLNRFRQKNIVSLGKISASVTS